MDADRKSVALDYSLASPRRWWTRPLVWCALVIFAAILTPVSMSLYHRWQHRSPFLAAQKQCLNFSLLPDTVIYDEDAKSAQQLWDEGKAPPGEWVFLNLGNAKAVASTPSLLQAFNDPDNPKKLGDFSSPNLFLHGRRAKGGPQRLVHVWLSFFFPMRTVAHNALTPQEALNAIQWEVVRPGTLFTTSAPLAKGSWGNSTFNLNMPQPLRIYAGQIDPADESHFTIQGMTPQGTLTIDGWLQANDQISFSVK